MTSSTPANQRKSGSDFTGRQTEQLNEAKKVEKREASDRMAMVAAELEEEKNTIIDLTDPENPVVEVKVRKVEVTSPKRTIRTNCDLPQVTWGRKVIDPGVFDHDDPSKNRPPIMGPMMMYDLKEGQQYVVPKEFAEHLNERGYLSYMGGV